MGNLLFISFHFLEVGSVLRHTLFSCFPSGCHWLWGLTGEETACRTEADSAKSWSWTCGLTWAMSPSLYPQPGIKGWDALMALASVATCTLLGMRQLTMDPQMEAGVVGKWKHERGKAANKGPLWAAYWGQEVDSSPLKLVSSTQSQLLGVCFFQWFSVFYCNRYFTVGLNAWLRNLSEWQICTETRC